MGPRTRAGGLWSSCATFQVRPSEVGAQPVLSGAVAAVLNHNGGSSDAPFPVPQVLVLSPATVAPPVPSATATQLAGPSPTLAPAPAPSPLRVYVPRATIP